MEYYLFRFFVFFKFEVVCVKGQCYHLRRNERGFEGGITMKSLWKVIVVDDELLVRQGIKHLLNWEREGYRIAGEASNGMEALDLVRELKPHLILTDIVMPVMGGEEFVRIVKERYPEIEIIVLSSFSEFDYVRSTFQSGVADYILKPKLEADYLLSVLNRTTAKMAALHAAGPEELSAVRSLELAVENLLTGYEADIDPELVRTKFPSPRFLLFGAEMKKAKDTEAKKRFAAELEKKMDRLDIGRTVHLRLKQVADGALYLLNFDPKYEGELLLALRRISQDLVTERGRGIHFLIGQGFADFYRFGEVYREHYTKLARYCFYLPDRLILEHNHLPKRPDLSPGFDLGELTELLKRKQFAKAFTDFQAEMSRRAKDYTAEIFEFKSLLGNFIFNVTTTLGKMKFEIGPLEKNKYDFFRAIDEATYASEAIVVVERFLGEAGAVVAGRQQQVNPNMASLLEYIHEHYAEPITLGEVARQFHFNVSYLSTYFASHNREGFNEYLNRLRMEKAKERLLMTDDAIADISESVGYSDQSYFTKVFKKMTGVSPGRYRRLHAAEMRKP